MLGAADRLAGQQIHLLSAKLAAAAAPAAAAKVDKSCCSLLPHEGLATQLLQKACQRVPIEKKRKDYTFRRQLNEKPSIIPGCPGVSSYLPYWVRASTRRL